jgi:hypothetical protein
MKLNLYYLHLTVALLISLSTAPAKSQSLNLNSPAPVHQGNNQALIDSFVGDHYYFFYAEPGKFHISWTWGNADEGSTLVANRASPPHSTRKLKALR